VKSPRFFVAAPWPRSLHLSSALGTVLIAGVSIAAYRAVPVPSGFTHYFGLVVALLPPVLFLWSMATMVTGYTVSQQELIIQRLCCSVTFSLAGIEQIYLEPALCKDAARLIGNAGLFGFSGLYQSSRLGRFRLFATDLKHAVVLVLADRTVVITPEAEQAFAAHLHRLFSAAKTAAV
jgi:uncharacterized membrane protein